MAYKEKTMVLLNDLYAAYGELLVKKGVEITPDIVRQIRERGLKLEEVRVPMKNSDIFKDFIAALNDERYKMMFEPPISRKEICDIAGKLMIENVILFELNNMKCNLPYTYKHVLIVTAFIMKLSLILKKNHYDGDIITHCGFTHDLGKTRIPIRILEKRGKLIRDEIEVIKTHPTTGYLLLNYYLKSDRIECSLASLEHHEKLDGSGYPKGRDRLTKYTKLISPVDIMDALTTDRPYRQKSFSLRASLDYLLREAKENRLDKEVVYALTSLAREDKPEIRLMKLSKEPREELPQDLAHEKFL